MINHFYSDRVNERSSQPSEDKFENYLFITAYPNQIEDSITLS